MSDFARFFTEKVNDYIQLRRALGNVFQSQAATLKSFCRFIEQGHYLGPLTRGLAQSARSGRE